MAEDGKKKEAESKQINPADLCVLVVDDDDIMRETTREIMETAGYTRIVEAKNGAEAVEMLSRHNIDLVISDWEMPELSGIELLEALRRHKDKHGEIPFIMVTSQISQERAKIHEAATTGVDAYIVKPFRAQTLKDKVQQVLEKKSQSSKGALIVDDDPSIREVLREHLQRLKFSPLLEAGDGEQALGILKEHIDEISMVICDWEMPKVTGIALLKIIRQDPELQKVPFIMVTAQTSIEQIKLKQAIEAKVDQYLMKPFTGDQLKDKIRSVIEIHKKRHSQEETLRRAEMALDSGMWSEAEQIYRRLLKSDPNCIEAYFGVGATQLAQVPKKQFEDAIGFIKRGIALNPQLDKGYIQMALAYESSLSIDRAIATLLEAGDHCPLSENILYHLGRLNIRRGHTDKGIENLNKALEINPDMSTAKELLQQAKTKASSSK